MQREERVLFFTEERRVSSERIPSATEERLVERDRRRLRSESRRMESDGRRMERDPRPMEREVPPVDLDPPPLPTEPLLMAHVARAASSEAQLLGQDARVVPQAEMHSRRPTLVRRMEWLRVREESPLVPSEWGADARAADDSCSFDAVRLPPSCIPLALAVAACGSEPKSPPLPPSPPVPVAALPIADAGLPVPGDLPIVLERDAAAKMRDGIWLAADVYRPKVDGKFPVLLTRTPYDRQRSAATAVKAATRGYVVIVQDVRGRYQSDGDFYPFKHEIEDGFDTVEWAAALPYSDGRVAVFGASYVGATTLLAAISRPPHLAAILPSVTASNYHEGWTYQGGALEQLFVESWSFGLAEETLQRRLDTQTPMDGVKVLPLGSYPFFDAGTPATLAPYFKDWLAHPAYDDYWRAWSIEDHYDAIRVPGLHVGGWYDIFLLGTLRNYVGLKAHGGQRLRIGPENHVGSAGEVNFGPEADQPLDSLRFFDSVLKGRPDTEKPVQIFVMGKNAWRGEDDWPLARAKETRYRLHAGGVLSTIDPATEPPTRSSTTRRTRCPRMAAASAAASKERRAPSTSARSSRARTSSSIRRRRSITTSRSPAPSRSISTSAPRRATRTSRQSSSTCGPTASRRTSPTASFACATATRARRRRSSRRGTTYRVSIDLAGTSNVFLAGHRLRLGKSPAQQLPPFLIAT